MLLLLRRNHLPPKVSEPLCREGKSVQICIRKGLKSLVPKVHAGELRDGAREVSCSIPVPLGMLWPPQNSQTGCSPAAELVEHSNYLTIHTNV